MDLDQIEALVEQLQKQVQSLKQGNGRSRQEAVTTATHISRMLETPGEWLVRTTWAEVSPDRFAVGELHLTAAAKSSRCRTNRE